MKISVVGKNISKLEIHFKHWNFNTRNKNQALKYFSHHWNFHFNVILKFDNSINSCAVFIIGKIRSIYTLYLKIVDYGTINFFFKSVSNGINADIQYFDIDLLTSYCIYYLSGWWIAKCIFMWNEIICTISWNPFAFLSTSFTRCF